MRSLKELPVGYGEIYEVDLQKNKKVSIFINLLSFAIAVVMMVVANIIVPAVPSLRSVPSVGLYIIKYITIILLCIGYLVIHELVHAAVMKACGTGNVRFGFTGIYAFAGSDDYYPKKIYIIIALAPLVGLGVILAIINAIVPYDWFWIVYMIQVVNVGGSAGDMYVAARFLRLPSDILVRDNGVSMKVYSKEIK